jgi:hypothetical protein
LNRDLLSVSPLKSNGHAVIPSLKPSLSPIPDRPVKPEVPSSSVEKLSVDVPPTAIGRSFDLRKVHISAPTGVDDFRLQLEQKRQQDADEEQASREYELKQQYVFVFSNPSGPSN